MSDNVIGISAGDREMARAMEAARATFPEFARQAELEHFRIVPAFESVAIKAFFADPARPGHGEHMFVTDVATDGTTVTGTLASEPGFESDLREGQEVTFPVYHVSDWFLVTGGKGIGGFTIDVLRRYFLKDQGKSYDAYPPYSWYRHRQGTTAVDELNAVPVCPKCQVRGLPLGSPQGDVCGICANNGIRCNCPRCGAPLIRYPDAPRECYRCLNADA